MLNLSHDELLLIIGAKEAHIYQQAKLIDEINHELKATKILECKLGVQVSELLKDRDMDRIELQSLKEGIARITMKAEKAV